jgi:hypothetical protein
MGLWSEPRRVQELYLFQFAAGGAAEPSATSTKPPAPGGRRSYLQALAGSSAVRRLATSKRAEALSVLRVRTKPLARRTQPRACSGAV